jgi:type VI secretion system protein ImpA
MSLLIATMLPDLSEASPAGENLEHDPDFVAMERAAERKPETQYGDVITPAMPPDWKEVDALASTLLERTRDLRVLVHMAVARLNLSGPPAFAEVLAQIVHQLETRWDVVHPRLDPEDDNDPTLRANTLSRLRDERNVLRALRDLPLARTAQTGTICWRDIAIFHGQIDPEPGHEKPSESLIHGAFNNTDAGRLAALREGIDLAVLRTAGISAAFDTLAGPVLDLGNLAKLLDNIQKDLKRFEPVIDEARPDAFEDAGETVGADQPPAVVRRGVTARSITSVTGRDDALYLLELVSSYFRTNEPTSPAPLLIDRARRLATMDFIDILRDLAPDGMGQAQLIAGQPSE